MNPNDHEYNRIWSDHVRYIYDERCAILTDGYRVSLTVAGERIARTQARQAHVEEMGEKASENLEKGKVK